MKNIQLLKSMLSKLEEVENDYYDVIIEDFKINTKASFILNRVLAVSSLVKDIIEDLEKKQNDK